MKSPCLTCTRVKDPQNCENKVCKEWRGWYIEKWEAMRRRIRDEIAGAPAREQGVPLGGQRYASPHQAKEFLDRDPCDGCHCPKDLCALPCWLKAAWAQKKGVAK